MAQSALGETLDADGWKALFMANGIKEDSAKTYGDKFAAEEVTFGMLSQLDRDLLKEMGVKKIGEALAILNIDGSASPSKFSLLKTPAPKLPQITSEMTHQQYRKFSIDWNVFLTMTRPPASQIHAILYSCCDDVTQTAIINTYPNFFKENVDELLDKVELIVTRKSNPTVHRMGFSGLMQNDHEKVNAFVVRLKDTAKDCEFQCPSCQHDLSKIYVRDQFIRGLNNDMLQTDILAKADQLESLEEVVKHSEAFEAAIRDQSMMQEGADIQHIRSEYRKKKLEKDKKETTHGNGSSSSQKKPCSHCGRFGHGASGAQDRKAKCPAWGRECYKCHQQNHYSRVCKYKSNEDIEQDGNAEALIAHITFDSESDMFISTRSDSVEEIEATLIPFSPKGDPRPGHKIPPNLEC